MQVLITGSDLNIILELQDNTASTGTYIDGNQAAINKIDSVVDKYINSTITQNLKSVNKAIINTTNTTIANSTNNVKPPINKTNKEYYKYITNYFNINEIFVTGTTSSKYLDLYNSHVDVLGAEDILGYTAGNPPSNSPLVNNKLSTHNKISSILSSTDNEPLNYYPAKLPGAKNLVSTNKVYNGVTLKELNSALNATGLLSKPVYKTFDDTTKLHKKITILGTDIAGMIMNISDSIEYVLYIDTEYPIKYIDFIDGTTTFMYKRAPEVKLSDANIILYPGLIEEPKILNEVFIDRGVNNAFEPIKRLKNVTSLSELTKIGLGYYKMNTQGFNFKNQ
jgi:hypothetical protein